MIYTYVYIYIYGIYIYIYMACISFLGALPAILRAESAPFCGSVECS